MTSDTIERMKTAWKDRTPGRIDEELFKDAAVLVPLVEQEGELFLLFEVRAKKLNTQPGEVCFPGGSIEPGELPEEAALRETMEELLLEKTQIERLAPLDVLYIPANMAVHPFLGLLKDYRGTFSPEEVEQIRLIPLNWFLENPPFSCETRVQTVPGEDFPYSLVPEGENYKWRQGRYRVLFYRYEGLVIWGMTAKILNFFIELCRTELPSPPPCGSGKKEVL